MTHRSNSPTKTTPSAPPLAMTGFSAGLNATPDTTPLCPGSLYFSLAFSTSQTYTQESADPDPTRVPSALNAHRKSAFSKLCECPTNRFVSRSPSTNARVSHILSVLSIELLSTNDPHGEMSSPVIVSSCPSSVISGLFSILASHARTTSSTPPTYARSPCALITHAVCGTACAYVLAARFFTLKSHTHALPSSLALITKSPLAALTAFAHFPRVDAYDFTCPPVSASHTLTTPSASLVTAHSSSIV
mmetsp:Transcript_6499/g.26083  ORF Transcript_6499/g.26083 Transcript_6499/m.26083 type:complete len:247 (-) Transcript_6499:406-1146(-)